MTGLNHVKILAGVMMSEKLLPIVPGCVALIVYHGGPICKPYLDMHGRQVAVIRKDRYNKGNWIVSGGGVDVIAKHYNVLKKNMGIPEVYLMRVDGGDFKAERDSYELPREIAT